MPSALAIIFLILIGCPSFTFAYEVIEICATYVGTGKKFKVEASVFKGWELNDRTNSFKHNAFSTYAVIFWRDGASLIELDFDGLSHFVSTGKDQRGYLWELSRSTWSCY